MSSLRHRLCILVAALAMAAPAAHAQFAVIDVAAVTQLVSEVQDLAQTLVVARDDLAEAQAQLQSMTGDRGMERLLSGVDRNYLPADWGQLTAALEGSSSTYAALSAAIRQALAQDAVLTPQQLDTLSPAMRQQLVDDRDAAALLQALSHAALANASSRFAELQQLITAIGSAGDQKSILDLNARIGAEQAMLENERTKLSMLVAAAQAQRWSDEEQDRERAIAGQGEFATRFQPTP
ncbi:MAG TPA: type IV secretion system protein [Steroidobacteraceae bacterium]|nr:type IV secretion system protein [Steroidobacteraceae bacterium]